MIAAYLWVNAVLYIGLAVWCTVRPALSAQSLGFVSLDASGRSEYLTIYGGLQMGLGLAFAIAAWKPALQPVGLAFALSLYAPIVLWRLVSVGAHGPVTSLTLAVAGLETLLLLGAIGVWAASR
jgi:hypothetical protein